MVVMVITTSSEHILNRSRVLAWTNDIKLSSFITAHSDSDNSCKLSHACSPKRRKLTDPLRERDVKEGARRAMVAKLWQSSASVKSAIKIRRVGDEREKERKEKRGGREREERGRGRQGGREGGGDRSRRDGRSRGRREDANTYQVKLI